MPKTPPQGVRFAAAQKNPELERLYKAIMKATHPDRHQNEPEETRILMEEYTKAATQAKGTENLPWLRDLHQKLPDVLEGKLQTVPEDPRTVSRSQPSPTRSSEPGRATHRKPTGPQNSYHNPADVWQYDPEMPLDKIKTEYDDLLTKLYMFIGFNEKQARRRSGFWFLAQKRTFDQLGDPICRDATYFTHLLERMYQTTIEDSPDTVKQQLFVKLHLTKTRKLYWQFLGDRAALSETAREQMHYMGLLQQDMARTLSL